MEQKYKDREAFKLKQNEKMNRKQREGKPYDVEEDDFLSKDSLDEEDRGQEDMFDEEGRNLPSVQDPKLWRVRVKKGFERIAASALMNKQIDFTRNRSPPRPFAIYSATYIDSIENFIFVEAHKIEAVRDAVQGLSYVFSSKIDIL